MDFLGTPFGSSPISNYSKTHYDKAPDKDPEFSALYKTFQSKIDFIKPLSGEKILHPLGIP
ncbi:MAG: hypothetical protein B7Y25_04645 [Alphaproteobacteria bacterium 16-39-46]|nr:MAG: hypothetical protein B7Y25_04645 [Alphaproteobacteria bacterium 16-39-46]OZA42944.1 MAG: hypothetical protein B7X84_04470 [Alphaproteobacteria bacterium 17-39-52]HQS84203.1 hypothetical protein [Alphaproteobacteria bacterium]HQS94051.1 hypothetical protein [Alphaproteobacteria bacterium]